MRVAEAGITELQKAVDTLLIIPNQNLFRVANEKTTFADAFAMADQVLYSGVACITDLMVKEGLINLDFADVRAVMREMGKAMMGTGEASGEKRALRSAEAAISNPLIDDVSMKGARGLLVSITGGHDLTLYEVDEAATRIREEVDSDANIIVGATFDESLEGIIRVSVVATGIDMAGQPHAADTRLAELAQKLRVPPQRHDGAPADAGCAPGAAHAQRQDAHDHERRRLPPAATIEDVTIRPMAPKPKLVAEPGRRAQRMPTTARPSSRRRRSVRKGAARACRASRNCRCRRRTKSARRAPRPRRGGSGETAALAAAAARFGRPWPPRGGPRRGGRRRASASGPTPRAATRRASDAAAPRPGTAIPDAGVGIRPPPAGPARPAPQGLDPHGRPAPHAGGPMDDDQLEIPAFLRRQAN